MQQIKDAFDVTGFVAEGNSGPTDKNGKRSVLKLEFLIKIEKEHNPNPGSDGKVYLASGIISVSNAFYVRCKFLVGPTARAVTGREFVKINKFHPHIIIDFLNDAAKEK
jgi:hypothetical protein